MMLYVFTRPPLASLHTHPGHSAGRHSPDEVVCLPTSTNTREVLNNAGVNLASPALLAVHEEG